MHNGRVYGYKNREFEQFVDLPRHTTQPFALAVGGRAPRERLREHQWQLVSPLAVTGTIEAYQEFIAGPRADFGIAKHAYVASRSGWFSDRSTCYVAAGRLDGFWELKLHAWDVAAGALIVEEAGGRVSDCRGGTMPRSGAEVVARNGQLHAQMLSVLDSRVRSGD